MVVQLRVSTPRGEEILFDLCDSEQQLRKMTVREMKEKITEHLNIGDLRIVYRTEPLEEGKLVVSFGIQHMSVVHILLMLSGGF